MARVLKSRRPDLQIVLGGVGCRGEIGEALLRHHDWIDVVVRSEAELVVPGVFEELLAGGIRSRWPGLCLRDENGIVINPEDNLNLATMTEVPVPDFDEYFEALADRRARGTWSPQILYEGARGCWWGHKHPCVFCGLNGPNPHFRAKPAAQVFKELQELVARYECPEVRFVEPVMDTAHLRELWPRVRDSDLDLSVYCETRPNLGRGALELMRDAGFKRINPGIESFSNPILSLLRKGTTALVNIRLLKWAAEMDLDVGWNFLFGVPNEPPEEYARMSDLILSLTHLKPPIAACPVTLHKNSPLYADPTGLGIKDIEPPMSYRMLFDLEEEHLRDLTFWFTYAYADDRRLESYVKPAIEAVNLWRGLYPSSYRTLTYLRGPGFIEIHDRRPHLRRQVYRFGELEAQLYVACDGGPRLETLWRSVSDEVRGETSLADVKDRLDDLVRARLVYAEDDRYLSLAIPGMTP